MPIKPHFWKYLIETEVVVFKEKRKKDSVRNIPIIFVLIHDVL